VYIAPRHPIYWQTVKKRNHKSPMIPRKDR
jgi:hypothetical protein